MKINANDLRVGNVIEHQGRLWQVSRIAHTQPGKGGAFIQAEMKDIKSGSKLNERFRSTESIEKARLEQKDYQYLYDEGTEIAIMDTENFEQMSIKKDVLGDKIKYLQEGMTVTVESYESDIISVTLPTQVTLEILECEPAIKGQTAANSNKPALVEGGARIMVPPFINQGDKVVVNTQEDAYVERAKD